MKRTLGTLRKAWFRSPRHSPNGAATRQYAPSTLLAIPIELRLEIYHQISHPKYLSNPVPSPLWVLTSVNHQLRAEVTGFLYSGTPTFTFLNVQHCLLFLRVTRSHLTLLQDLTVSVAYDNTFALESIFELLLKEGEGQLKRLTIKLVSIDTSREPPPPGYLLPKELGERALRRAYARARRLEALFDIDLTGKEDAFRYRGGEQIVRMAMDSSNSYLGKMRGIRYLRVEKRPAEWGVWAVEFELAVLRVWSGLFDIAAREGGRVRRKSELGLQRGVARTWWWGNEGWVDVEGCEGGN